MKFSAPLLRATLIRRYKRFLADVEMPDGEMLTVHCANPGAMLGLNMPGMEVWLSDSNNPKRKLRYSWELARVGDAMVGINTAHPNRIAEEAILAKKIPGLAGYAGLRREVNYGRNSRIDLLLEDAGRGLCYVEVKNAHLMRQPGLAEFPDSVTKRGTKHLSEMVEMVAQGHRAVMLYVVQRDDCNRFAVARDIDPTYASAVEDVKSRGVEIICYDCRLSTEAIILHQPLPIIL
ncbi:MAG: DNA/RNA nuclease SfsA [Alphaproteobacteria bacterium]|nr:DNA/RNA nuclease SfsA [Alphaproteobacteria bacterium]